MPAQVTLPDSTVHKMGPLYGPLIWNPKISIMYHVSQKAKMSIQPKGHGYYGAMIWSLHRILCPAFYGPIGPLKRETSRGSQRAIARADRTELQGHLRSRSFKAPGHKEDFKGLCFGTCVCWPCFVLVLEFFTERQSWKQRKQAQERRRQQGGWRLRDAKITARITTFEANLRQSYYSQRYDTQQEKGHKPKSLPTYNNLPSSPFKAPVHSVCVSCQIRYITKILVLPST